MSEGDSHLLARIDQKLTDFIEEFNKVRKKVEWHDKFVYMGMGGILIIEIDFKIFK